MNVTIEHPTTAFGHDCVLSVECEVELPESGPKDWYGRLQEPNDGLTVTPISARIIYWSNQDMEVVLDPPLDAAVDTLDWDAIHDKVADDLAARLEDAAENYYHEAVAEHGG